MEGVLLWGGVVVLNVLVMWALNRGRLDRREAASMRSALVAAATSTAVVHGVVALAARWQALVMWLPLTIITIGGASLIASWLCVIVSERWSHRSRPRGGRVD